MSSMTDQSVKPAPSRSPSLLWRLGLRTKLVTAFVLVAILSVGAVTIIGDRALRANLTENVGASLKTLAENQANVIGNLMHRQLDLLNGLSLNKVLQDEIQSANASYTGSAAEIENEMRRKDLQWMVVGDDDPLVQQILSSEVSEDLREFQSNFPENVEMLVTDKNGAVVAATKHVVKYNNRNEEWWQSAYNNGQGGIYVSQPMLTPPGLDFGIVFAVPVRGHMLNDVVGVMQTTYRIDALQQALARAKFGRTGLAQLLLPSGQVIADSGGIGTLDSQALEALNANFNANAVEIPFQGTPSLVSQASVSVSDREQDPTVAALGWRLLVAQSAAEALEPVNNAAQPIFVIGLGALIMAALLGLVSTQLLTGPITRLTAVARQVSEGDLAARARVESGDEIGVLAETFNGMTAELSQTLSGLEQRVAERTEALETSRDELERANVNLQANSAYLAALNETSAGLMARLETGELLNTIMARAAALVNTESGYVYLADADKGEMELRVGSGLYESLVGTHIKPGVGLAGTVWASGESLAVDDYQNWPGRLSGTGRATIQAAVGVPLKSAGQVVGVLGLAHTEPGRKFGETEIQILNRFAQLAVLALENARLFEQTQTALAQSEQQARVLQRLNVTSAEIASARDFAQVVEIASHAVQEILAPDRISVTMALPDGENFQVYAVEGEGGAMPIGETMSLAGTQLAEALREQRLKYAPDITVNYNNPGAMMTMIRQGLRAVINAPLLFDDVAVGALNVSSKTPDRFSSQDLVFVQQIAALASTSLQRLRLLEQTRSALSETELLYRATRELGNVTDLQGLLGVALDFGAAQGLPDVVLALENTMDDPQAPRFTLHRATRQGDEIVVASPTPANDLWSIPDEAFVIVEGSSLLAIADVTDAAVTLPGAAKSQLEKMGVRALVGVQLGFGDGRVGYLTFASAEPSTVPTQILLRRVAAFGQQFDAALENQRLYEQTQLALAEARRAAEREHDAAEQILALNRRLTGEGWQEYLATQAGGVRIEDALPNLNGESSELPELEHAAAVGGLVISKENGHSALAVPIVVRGEVIGTVGLEDVDPNQEWSEERIGIINDVVQSLGLALDNARLYSEAQRRVTELDALNRISQAATSELDLESLLSIIGEQVRQIFDVQNTYVALYDRATQMITLPYFVNDGKRVQVEPIRFGEGLTSEIIRTRQPLILNQTADDTMAKLGAKVFGNPAQSYLGVPILVGEEVTGVISIQSTSRENMFDEGNVRLLETIAATVGAAIQNAQLYGAMEQEVQERKRAEEEIKLSLKEKEVLLKEIHHRVKNNLQIITSLLNLQSAQIKDPEALLMFRESQARVRSMALIHEKLYQSKDLARIDFAGYVRELMVYLFRSYTVSPDQIQTELDTSDIYLGIDTAIPCGLIISELVTNSMKYAFPGGKRGKIYVGLHPLEDGNLELKVVDNGVGLPDDFDWRESDSLGLQLVSTLTAQLHGKMHVSGRDGACFTLTFPG